MYSHLQTMPPSATFNSLPGSVGLSIDGAFSHECSPELNAKANTILPKVRSQDQIPEPTGGPVRHRRTTSTLSLGYGSPYNPYARPNAILRRGLRTLNHNNTYSDVNSPASTSSYDLGLTTSTLNSPISFADTRRPSLATHGRSQSASGWRGHSRAGSAGSIDESVISRFGFPTFPSYVTASSAAQPSMTVASSFPPTIPSTYAPVQDISSFASTTSTIDFATLEYEPSVRYPIAAPLNFDDSTSSLLNYLTSPNPSPALVRRVTSSTQGLANNFWWDIRNLRSWTDFNIQTITSLPSVLPLLQVLVPASCLPQPPRTSNGIQPENESALHDILSGHYATKLNAALGVAQGSTHMVMRPFKSSPPTTTSSRSQPEFVSNYPSDYGKTIFGDSRGRVVGLVKCYDQWNTGMRGESPPMQVLYLQGLAHLHRVMREHGCRYGFIITEIELLCVRCGGDPNTSIIDPTTVNAQSGIPIFGYLELSPPITLSTQGQASDGSIQMTAGLALWFLHMLAKENPFEGIGTWKMEVGGPAALTRQNLLERDAWIPKPLLREKREAKKLRGWAWPDEPLSKTECGRGKRAKSLG